MVARPVCTTAQRWCSVRRLGDEHRHTDEHGQNHACGITSSTHACDPMNVGLDITQS
jgi:hypothetical protein